MTTKPRRPQPDVDANQLNHADFRWFILHYPAFLIQGGIRRTSWVAIGLTLAQFGDYATGTRVNPSKKLLHHLTGAHHTTITKMLEYLKRQGVLEVTDKHQGRNGGQPYEVFRFRRNDLVKEILEKRDAHDWPQQASPIPAPASATPEPANAGTEPATASPEDNRNDSNEMNVKNRSGNPSPAPVVAPPSARDGAAEESEPAINWSDETVAELIELFKDDEPLARPEDSVVESHRRVDEWAKRRG
ncbi:hypothetical protein HD600_000203 [Microbacterium ginsengiterrae]|uniref:Helix-turn-helix protein n=1 Tax=Microbacterium ginsengiterrae TaxID=546115 RepID=A0A7W9C9U7_9MICO|nr:hypothetical protein [Microbacterium ginsengiterrae]MBB5741706.1 hypothetical protein [Microbacterium ginsengiterrae]